MIFSSVQEAISTIQNFLRSPVDYGAAYIAGSVVLTLLITVISLRAYYHAQLKKLKEGNRSLERGIADLEAKEAQVNGELEDLRKAEAILIHRNGVLDGQVKEYEILCAQQEKRMATIELLFSK